MNKKSFNILLVTTFIFFLMIAFSAPFCEASGKASAEISTAEHQGTANEKHGSEGGGHHGDPYAEVFKIFAIILICAIIGRFGAKKLKQSAVLGELVIGIIVGAILYQVGSPIVTIIRHNDLVQTITHQVTTENVVWQEAVDTAIKEAELPKDIAEKIRKIFSSDDFPQYFKVANSILLFSSLGVILLLFMVGLESSLEEMKEVGLSAFLVAVGGVVFSFVFGYFIMLLLLPKGTSHNIPLFVGAALCATSIGITARVFQDMGKLGMSEAKIVLGAAVLDDVMGLIVLAVVSGIITSGSVKLGSIGLILLKSGIFMGALVFFAVKLLDKDVAIWSWFAGEDLKLVHPFALLMILAWLADLIGLAAIVGAFGAGLVIKEEFYQKTKLGEKEYPTVEAILSPIEGIFAPVFFVLMGLQVDVSTFADMNVLLIGLVITVVAIISKALSGVFVTKGNDKFIIGIGMIPRGEVGLIFASIGKSLGVLDKHLFSVVIIFVLLTTLVTPPLLKWSIDRKVKSRALS